ncbi:MAG: hypothetical protein KDA41_19720, partial [Planctomycetales bacterium]|nr:hypothetical protein [Planctomycetales bacterium]
FAAGEALSQDQKLQYLGRKTIAKYGCYACHDVPGFEGAKPIGTALADWGRKEPAKLAFEHISHYAGGHGHGHGAANSEAGEHASHEAASAPAAADAGEEEFFLHELNHQSRMGFLYQKLKEPRSYDFDKTENKPYNDRLRMPQFPFDFAQRQDVMTFVLGLVADPPARQFVYSPSPRQHAINQGRKVLDKFNCGGCHELNREQWTVSMPAGWEPLRDPEPAATFPFLMPHLTPEEVAESEKATPGGRQVGTLAGRVKRTTRGDVDAWVFSEDEGDYLTPDEIDDDEFAIDSLAYRFELYEPALLAGKLYMPKAALPLWPLDMVQGRRASRGGTFAE